MEAYSQDLRDRVLRALERGERPVDIARPLEVSRIWVYQVKNRFKTSGERCSRPIGGHRVSRLAPAEEEVRAWIKKQPDLTLTELGERLRQEKGIELKIPALWHQLNKWGLSFKKLCTPASRSEKTCAWPETSGEKHKRTKAVNSSFFLMRLE